MTAPSPRPLHPATSRREAVALALAALCFCCVLCSYYLVRPIREQFASAAGGSQALPLLHLLVLLAMLLMTPVYGALVSRYPRRVFVPATFTLFACCLLAMGPLLRLSPDPVLNARLFFVWVSVFNLFVVSVFWSCMSDVFDTGQARRLYGLIALGGTAGALAGPLLARQLVPRVGLDGLYLLAAAFLAVALACLLALFAQRPRGSAGDCQDDALGGGIWEGAGLTLADPFLRRMAVLLFCADGVATVLYSTLSDYARQAFADPVARTGYFAGVDLWTNAVQVLLQVFVVRWLLTRAGAGRAMAWPNLLNVGVLLAIAIHADAALVALGMILSRGGGYGLVNPARESLFTRVPRAARYKAKAFIDTVVWRGGDLVLVTLVAAMVRAGSGVATFGALAAGFALASVLLSWHVERHLRDATADDG